MIANLLLAIACAAGAAPAGEIDLSGAIVVTRGDAASQPERNAAVVLVEEAERRTGVRWKEASAWPERGPVIAVAAAAAGAPWGDAMPRRLRDGLGELQAEGYRLLTESRGDRPIVWIIGADARGTLFGVGRLLRELELAPGRARLAGPLDMTTAPAYPLRGHQLGYRARANSYDAWDERQYEQYVRELAVFGANAVENIPFQDRDGPHMRLPRREMNRRLSDICQRYDLEYWVWTPADFDLNDKARRDQALADHEQLYADCPRLDGVFVPGGDPGDNHPKLVLPFLADLAGRLARHHPRAKLWLSMQGYDAEETDFVPDLGGEIERLCESLFRSIGLQTSVPRYQADGAERGAVLDFVHYPLNNRWWLEDEFAAIRKLPSEEQKLARLELIRTWENPGPGSFYDDVGNVARSPHVMRGETPETDPLLVRNPNPSFHGAGRPRARQTWHSYMDWPIGMRYDGLDPAARYDVRTTGLGDCLLRVDGQRVEPTLDGKGLGEFKEFPVPAAALGDGTLILTFDVPHEPHLNWRQQSRLTELWLLRR